MKKCTDEVLIYLRSIFEELQRLDKRIERIEHHLQMQEPMFDNPRRRPMIPMPPSIFMVEEKKSEPL